MTQVAPAESQLLCHGGREGTAKWDLSPLPPGWDAGTLQLEVSKYSVGLAHLNQDASVHGAHFTVRGLPVVFIRGSF